MDHVAIMRKDWKLIPKILSGEKKIESRWYMARYSPWNRVKAGDPIYFKDAGEPVTAKASVQKVLQLENYTPEQLQEILDQYGGPNGICLHSPLAEVFLWAQKRKYCILIFLNNPQKTPPFEIDKTGFGNACAWLTVPDIRQLRVP
jgi:ASC-1-like (ASCH) protein